MRYSLANPRGCLQSIDELRRVLIKKREGRLVLYMTPIVDRLVSIKVTPNTFITGRKLCQVMVLSGDNTSTMYHSITFQEWPLLTMHIEGYPWWIRRSYAQAHIFTNYWLAHAHWAQWLRFSGKEG